MQTIKTNNTDNYSAKHPLAGGIFFIVLFLVWVVVGGFFLFRENERSIYRAINEQHTVLFDAIFPYITHMGEAMVIISGLLLLLLIPRFRTRKFLLAFVICNLTPFLLTQAVKSLVNAPRPLKYFQEADWINRVAGQPVNYDYSFPSGHSEGSFAFFCFLALILPKKFAPLGMILFLLALSVGYSRIYLSQHFYADVYTGSIIGTLCCLISFCIINPFKPKEIVVQ